MKTDNPIIYKHEALFWSAMKSVHHPSVCEGQICVVHNPLSGPWRTLSLWWRGDLQIVERSCSHGIGHPDPSQFSFWRATGQPYECLHGCDGCCSGWGRYARGIGNTYTEENHQ